MKKLLSILLILPLVLWTGCGDDNGTNGDDDNVVRLVADTSVRSPDITIVDDPVWDSVATTTVAVDTVIPRVQPPLALSVANSISLQAIKKNDYLFLRAIWIEDSLHLIKDAFKIKAYPDIEFDHYEDAYYEDQLMVMFTMPGSTWYDVWNWRSLQTAQGNLAEGANYYPAYDDTLCWVVDSGDLEVACENPKEHGMPKYLHKDGSDFHGQVLYSEDTIIYRYFPDWEIGQIVPGWYIDTTVADTVAAFPESRWDVASAYAYDSEVNQLTVVLARKLDTGWPDDMDLSAVGTVTLQIGLYNNQSKLREGGSKVGFTEGFTLVLP